MLRGITQAWPSHLPSGQCCAEASDGILPLATVSQRAGEMIERTSQTAAADNAAIAAFISYAREDEPIAAALQAGLIEMARASPTVAREPRLRVFRDATNLVPGQGLSDALRQHLASSRKLKAARILDAMAPSPDKAQAFMTVADTELQNQQQMPAKRTLARAWSALHAAGYINPPCNGRGTAVALGSIAARLLAMNEPVGARTVASECRGPTRSPESWLVRYSALAAILEAYTR